MNSKVVYAQMHRSNKEEIEYAGKGVECPVCYESCNWIDGMVDPKKIHEYVCERCYNERGGK